MGFQRFGTIVLYGLAAAIPTALLVSSARVFTALEDQKAIYLRSRVAAVAAHLETMSDKDSSLEVLAQEEPALLDLKTFRRSEAPSLRRMWDGVELFQTQTLTSNGMPVFRANIPFHREGEMRIAQIDLDAGAADFLVQHARHQIWIAFISAFALATLSIYAVWAERRTYLLEQQQLTLKHLAHLGEMSAGLAHEIRNPLGTIKGFAQLLAESSTTQQKPLIEPIVSETLRLEALVEDLLRFGRPPLPAIREVDWQTIEQSLVAHAAVFDGRFRASGEQFRVRTDPNLLEQALLNLLRNAFDAAENRVEIAVKREKSIKKLQISVLDDGPGIPPAIREHLFEPFRTTKALGTGLGLSISKKLVESLGGKLELRDRAPKGTEAVILLPFEGA